MAESGKVLTLLFRSRAREGLTCYGHSSVMRWGNPRHCGLHSHWCPCVMKIKQSERLIEVFGRTGNWRAGSSINNPATCLLCMPGFGWQSDRIVEQAPRSERTARTIGEVGQRASREIIVIGNHASSELEGSDPS
jgi:hypothetical protein